MNNGRGARFSNEKYLTRNQVAKEMNSTLIENIWQEVIDYRSLFMTTLTLRTVERNKLRVVYTPKINDKIMSVERKLTSVYNQVNKIKLRADFYSELHFKLIKNVLTTVSERYHVVVNDGLLNQIINGSISALSPQELVLDNYYKALFMYKGVSDGAVDHNLLMKFAECFNIIAPGSFPYRQSEIKTQSEVALIGRLYLHVPVNQISEMLDDILNFVQSSNAPSFVKFVAIFFFLSYIKPFEFYSEEIALLFAKAFLISEDLESIVPYINFEALLTKYQEEAVDIMNEVKRTNDLTYFVDFISEVTFTLLKKIDEVVISLKAEILKQEQLGLTPLGDQSLKPKPMNLDLFAFVEEESKPYVPSRKEEVKVEKLEEETPLTALQTQDLAFSGFPQELGESDARKLETHLRESNPTLSKAEAYFFARHCTLGKYYTISQFKDILGCAYETARTSMDHLAASGYYRKEKLKNKFIYTPNKL